MIRCHVLLWHAASEEVIPKSVRAILGRRVAEDIQHPELFSLAIPMFICFVLYCFKDNML